MLVILRGLSELSLKRMADRRCREVRRNGDKGASLGQCLQEQETGRTQREGARRRRFLRPLPALWVLSSVAYGKTRRASRWAECGVCGQQLPDARAQSQVRWRRMGLEPGGHHLITSTLSLATPLTLPSPWRKPTSAVFSCFSLEFYHVCLQP